MVRYDRSATDNIYRLRTAVNFSDGMRFKIGNDQKNPIGHYPELLDRISIKQPHPLNFH
jgi:hypothetical protein